MRVTLATDNNGYNIYFNNDINATAQHSNILQIQADTVQTIDDLSFHEASVLYMLDMINQLERLANTSADKEIKTDDFRKAENNA